MPALRPALARLRPALARVRRALAQLAAPLDRLRFPEAREPSRHWQREAMYAAVWSRVAQLGPQRLRAAEISGTTYAGQPWREYASLPHPEFDLCELPERHDRYDVVICEQVLEHVPDPWLAARNLRRLCAPGGTAIVSTPFLIRVHELPEYGMADYWRFTPRGLRTLLEAAGFEAVEVGAWGNRHCVRANFDRWAARRPWHPRHNEPDLPVQVWAFARNPDSEPAGAARRSD